MNPAMRAAWAVRRESHGRCCCAGCTRVVERWAAIIAEALEEPAPELTQAEKAAALGRRAATRGKV